MLHRLSSPTLQSPVKHYATALTASHRAFTSFAGLKLPPVQNEPLQNYAPGSVERELMKQALEKTKSECPDIPCIINGEEIRTGETVQQFMPSNKSEAVCTYHRATPQVLQQAIQSAMDAKAKYEAIPAEDRLAIFTKASWLLSKVYRYELNAATMLGQGKTVWQAEIDAAAELIDFWRFGAKFIEEMYNNPQQSLLHDDAVWNRLEFRPLEGFCLAISPFNFTAIGGNLCATPALLGNVGLWKPASTSVLANYVTYKILEEAGLPPGVINFIPSQGSVVSEYALKHPDLAAVNFTGSTAVFRDIWYTIGSNIANYKSYPRIVGETGGKNFHVVHGSADVETVANATIRGAFEYQGQKCSATSRMYVAKSIWSQLKGRLIEETQKIKVGQPDEFDSFMTAVIDGNAFNSIKEYIEHAKADSSCSILVGGGCDDSKGWFVYPTIIETTDPASKTMREEIFGPVLTVMVYDDDKFEEILDVCDKGSDYALTGSIFAQDRNAVVLATRKLRHSAGNFYINDKSTGSIVAQQPFGGARASGTNDKAGFMSIYNRFCSIRSIKENMLPQRSWRYPSMQPDAQ
eukprot:CAMPEP_0197026722 /NCGR_PEP_ID=MMETSP1384-20130603/6753_1 /TAXON_ID=29189 /ORGANISM="Ammonia sp." /LENGTH=576 /DNA_ID=CAMNT_0042455441 /DNA_START=18 /DNA_END=1748 /DNA_ORIENTATION=+